MVDTLCALHRIKLRLKIFYRFLCEFGSFSGIYSFHFISPVRCVCACSLPNVISICCCLSSSQSFLSIPVTHSTISRNKNQDRAVLLFLSIERINDDAYELFQIDPSFAVVRARVYSSFPSLCVRFLYLNKNMNN